jgi:hypothetical protein
LRVLLTHFIGGRKSDNTASNDANSETPHRINYDWNQ